MSKRFMHLHAIALLATACGAGVTEPPPPPTSSATDIFLAPDARVIEQLVPRRATLASLLDDHQFAGAVAAQLIDAVRVVFDPRRLRVGNPYRLMVAASGAFRRFEYHIDEDEFLRVSDGDPHRPFTAELVPYVKERTEVAMRGGIDAERTSLVAALDGAGENVMLAIRMAEAFGGEIDFNNDLRRGDEFEVLFEKYFREGEFSAYGEVLAAEFLNDGRRVQAFRFQVPGETEAQYFDADGRSMKRLFLRSPFRFEPRVTSRFSYRRLHPVLGGRRPPSGGRLRRADRHTGHRRRQRHRGLGGRSGGSGNMVRLRHTNGYETYYLHLSAFADGIRRGARVSQGQVIGRVGATGLVTGPHLDYRMRKNGTFVNPLIEHRNLPPGDPVPDAHLASFRDVRDQALGKFVSASLPAPSPVDYAQ